MFIDKGENNMSNDNTNELLIDESILRNKIYTIRGQQVMFDFDLAEIYGYTTKTFNQQVKNNTSKFPDDFRFQLTKNEVEEILRSKNLTSRWGGSRYLPYVFTEQGIYMLMTVLRGDLATKQSITLIRLFKSMKDYLAENRTLLPQADYYSLTNKIEQNSKDIESIRETMITKSDLPEIMKLFDRNLSAEEILILDGEPFKADEAYQKIYKSATSSIIVIDDYIRTKTLHHLAHADINIILTVITDNAAKPRLSLAEYKDFLTENSGKKIDFLQSLHRSHDRYIILDFGTSNVKIYHCGASSKDAGNRITTITRLQDTTEYTKTINAFLNNPVLLLK